MLSYQNVLHMLLNSEKIGKLFAERIALMGYQRYSHFIKEFKKKAPVTLSAGTLSAYVHGAKPSLERFHALADFLGFSDKEKQKMENAYGGLRSKEPYHPSPDQSRRIGIRYNRKKKAERIALPKKGNTQQKKTKKYRPSSGGQVRGTKDLLRYKKFLLSYREVAKKAPSKKVKLLLFELALG